MAFSIARLTLFAIISSIEDDLRALILLTLQENVNITELFPEEDYRKCLLRLKKDQEEFNDVINYEDIIYYADLSDLY